MQMIQDTLRDVLKKVAGERRPEKTVVGQKNCRQYNVFQNFLDEGVFLAKFEDGRHLAHLLGSER